MRDGSYKVQFGYDSIYSSARYATEWWDDQADVASADVVVVADGGSATVDAVVEPLRSISGTISWPTATASGCANVEISTAGPSPVVVRQASACASTGSAEYVAYVEPGVYRMRVTSGGYEPGWFGGATEDLAATIDVTTADASGIDASLRPAASIAGVVTDSSGAPLQGVYVYAWRAGYQYSANTAENGSYRIAGLPAGDYTVQVQDWSYTYVGEWFDDVADQASATAIELAAGEAVAGVDASLATAGSIAGVVTDSAGAPLESIYVYAVPGYGGAYTAADGSYRIAGLAAGSYQVRFNGSSAYAGEWFDDVADQGSATGVVVAAGEVVSGVDASLVTAGSISGVVTDSAGAPLESIYVYRTPNGQGTYTAADGSYRFDGLGAGTFAIRFIDFAAVYLTESATVDSVVVAAGEAVVGVDASLAAAAGISGTVTDDAGFPLGDVLVRLVAGNFNGVVRTDESGNYRFVRSAGTYELTFSKPGYGGEGWGEQSGASAGGDEIVIVDGVMQAGIDAKLGKVASIVGTVFDPSGGPVNSFASGANTIVRVYDENGTVVGSAIPGYPEPAPGRYVVGLSGPGNYRIAFETTGTSPKFVTEYYPDVASLDASIPVTVLDGEWTTVDATLDRYGWIEGTLTTEDGGADPYGYVRAGGRSAWFQNGTYRLDGLETGTYEVEFEPLGQTYSNEWYDNARTSVDATPVAVTMGAGTSGIDVQFDLNGRISGHVTGPALQPPVPSTTSVPSTTLVSGQQEASDVPVGGLLVTATRANGSYVTSTVTQTDGTYELVGLGEDSFIIEITGNDDYLGEFYDDAVDRDSAQLVSVGAQETVPGVDAVLTPAAKVAGTVTDDAGVPLEGIIATMTIGAVTRSATSGADGQYRVGGLPAGDVVVRFHDPAKSHLSTWWPAALYLGAASTIVVLTGQEQTGIDAVLDRSSSIAGTITGVDGAPVQGVRVSASGYPWSPGSCGVKEIDQIVNHSGSHSALTAATGSYVINGLRCDDYWVSVSDQSGEYASASYPGPAAERVASGSGNVAVWPDSQTSGTDFQLVPTVKISGEVRGLSNQRLSGIEVDLYDDNDVVVAMATTNSSGAYQFAVLSDEYRIQFRDPNRIYANEWFDDVAGLGKATPVFAEAGSVKTANATLRYGGSISGLVVDDRGEPADGVWIELRTCSSTSTFCTARSVLTGADGTYQLDGVTPGPYRVRFVDPGAERFVAEYHLDASDYATATPIEIDVDVVANVDATLTRAATIQGVVADSSGNPLDGIVVSGTTPATAITTGADGTFTLRGFRTGTQRLTVSDPTSEFLSEQPEYDTTLSELTGPVTVVLYRPSILQGVVTNDLGDPVPEARVTIRNSATNAETVVTVDAAGSFAFTNVRSGDYRIRTLDLAGWHFAAAYGDPFTVPVETTVNSDLVLEAGGRIAGQVTNGAGTAVQGIYVQPVRSDDSIVATYVTGSDGRFASPLLTVGDYRIRLTDPADRYASQYYYNSTDLTGASAVTVSGVQTSTTDIGVTDRGSISGIVTDGSGIRLQASTFAWPPCPDRTSRTPAPRRPAATARTSSTVSTSARTMSDSTTPLDCTETSTSTTTPSAHRPR